MQRIPFQKMLLDVPVQVIRLKDFYDSSSFQAHRHNFYMLLWITKGKGRHEINFRTYELLPERIVFVHEGNVHRVITQPEDGWMILFQAPLFRAFIHQYPAQEQHGLFDYINRHPYVDADQQTLIIYQKIISLLAGMAEHHPVEPIITAYLALLLYHANQLFRPLPQYLIHPAQAEKVRQLKRLIEQHYLTERTAPFYAEKLGIVTRKLNEVTFKLTGRLVHELINDRLLSEAEALLGGTNLTIKEITFELRFIDHSHFAFYFKKQKGITPTAFRRQVASSYT